MNRFAADRGVPISKTSIWHLALHAAAIRGLLNRCTEEKTRENKLATVQLTCEADSGAEFNSIHVQVLNLLRTSHSRLLSANDITCLLALDGKSYSSTWVRIVLDDLCRWAVVIRSADGQDDELYRTAESTQSHRVTDKGPGTRDPDTQGLRRSIAFASEFSHSQRGAFE